ncbi:hypothetical protein D3874_21775 [Oleomonas cavernae]|uniref:Uncharacterized protein n=1 Tax=Oleomonas cavernae TaxID=2320859 RepID=A0A418VTE2_9PROT|nr:hypothetical protein [Oleomonas cavernae]RJF80118.1 hypothetical protein D3874_27645 [Oleomonas cavernae]RJF80124.1 hypothetical protein D3874_27675 [Oleomonas cavernae]RJF89274.1 hypothetical protein D3874_21775 [Oleomonas cavernae]
MSKNLFPTSLYNDPEFIITLKGYIEALLPFNGPPIRLGREDYTVQALRWHPRGSEVIPADRFQLLHEVGCVIGHEAAISNGAVRDRFRKLIHHCPHIGIYADAIDRLIDTGKQEKISGDLIHKTYCQLRLEPAYQPTISPFLHIA